MVDFSGGVEGDCDVGEFFVEFRAFLEECHVAAFEGFEGGFVFLGLVGLGPDDGFGVFEVFLEHGFFHFGCGFDVNDEGFAFEFGDDFFVGVDDGAGGVDDGVLVYWLGEDVLHGLLFEFEVAFFVFGELFVVGLAEPFGHVGDAFVSEFCEFGGELGFDVVVAADVFETEVFEFFGPMAFADVGHADEADGKFFVFEFVDEGEFCELFVEGDAGDADDVAEDSSGGDFGACAWAFDN